LREKPELRVFDIRVLRIIFGHKRDKETEEWRKLHSETPMTCTPQQILF
jgi:hypothetical protein